jgi:mono/diheme cytochrome c family protein
MKKLFCWVLTLAGANVFAQAVPVTPEQIKAGAEIYATNCATCHGKSMRNPEWAIDLATIPKNDRPRFIQSVTSGKNSMPPWGDVLKPADIEALWAYFSAGEK